MFDKTYELSLVKDYVSHWGLYEAVRELIQNALDSESPFKYEFTRDGADDLFTLILTSEFATLPASTLLLGSTSKTHSNNAIGSFGEGYKIALLVLTRLGKTVLIDNADKRWTPRFKLNTKYNQELLVIEEASLNYKNSGLRFMVEGLSLEEIQGITASCLQMQSDVGEVKSTTYGEILIDRPGKLYVGGLYICDIQAEYGYNVKPQFLKLERDRQTVSNWDLQSTTTHMWYDTKEYDRIAGMIEGEIPDVSYAQYSSPELVKEACYRRFKEQYPGAIAATSQKELDELVSKGMTKVVHVNQNFGAQLRGNKDYASQVFIAVKPVHELMTEWLAENRKEMRTHAIVNFKQLIEQSKKWVAK